MTLAQFAIFGFAAVQALAAAIQISDQFRKGKQFAVTLLIVGSVAAFAVALWMTYHPPQPVVVTQTKVIDRAVPCPPAKSGAATTRGTQSPAISGSNNGVTYGEPPAAAKKP